MNCCDARVRLPLSCAHETAGAARARHSLRPLFGEGENFSTDSGEASRERERLSCRHCRATNAERVCARERSDDRLRRRSPRKAEGRLAWMQRNASGVDCSLTRALRERRARTPPRRSFLRVEADERDFASCPAAPPGEGKGKTRSARLTIFWHCGFRRISRLERARKTPPRQPTVNGFGRRWRFQRVWQC